MNSIKFEATGTLWEIQTIQDISSIEEDVRSLIEKFESTYSRFRNDSLISKLNTQVGTFVLPTDGKKLFDTYWKMEKITNGLFTPLIGKNLNEAGYNKEYTFQDTKLSDIKRLANVIDYEYPNIITKEKVQLDFGAAGKGYLIDLVGELLDKNNINEYIIDAGMDIKIKGQRTLKIGLEHPLNKERVIGIANINNKSICGSSGIKRNWGKYHHIINPVTKQSPSDILGIWVITDTTIEADAISTALFMVEPQVLENEYNFEYVIVNKDFTSIKSKNFDGELFVE